MSEIGTKPSGTATDPANLNWATTATIGVDVVEPAFAKRNTGWIDKEKPPYETFNWFWRLVALLVAWISAAHVRAFEELETATDATAVTPLVEGEVFRIDYRAGIPQPLSEAWATIGAVATATNIVSDGQFVYYSQGQLLYRALRLDGTVATSRDLGAAINDVSANGNVVCATTQNQAPGEFFCVDRLTLADSAGFPLAATGNGQHSAHNGDRICYSDDSTSVQILFEATGLTVASPNYGATVYDICVDYERLYVTGADAGAGVQVRAYQLSNGALKWSNVLWVSPAGTAVMNAIEACGERIYVGGDLTTKGGVSWNLSALDRETGSRVWQVNAGGIGSSILRIAVDEQYVWAIDDNEVLFQYTRDFGTYVKSYTPGGGLFDVDTDADSVFLAGDVGLDANRLRRLYRGNPSKAYVIASGTDPNRRPFHKLAIPGDKL